jgi:hypothetical protein
VQQRAKMLIVTRQADEVPLARTTSSSPEQQ